MERDVNSPVVWAQPDRHVHIWGRVVSNITVCMGGLHYATPDGPHNKSICIMYDN